MTRHHIQQIQIRQLDTAIAEQITVRHSASVATTSVATRVLALPKPSIAGTLTE
jgi:hypothetical protein